MRGETSVEPVTKLLLSPTSHTSRVLALFSQSSSLYAPPLRLPTLTVHPFIRGPSFALSFALLLNLPLPTALGPAPAPPACSYIHTFHVVWRKDQECTLTPEDIQQSRECCVGLYKGTHHLRAVGAYLGSLLTACHFSQSRMSGSSLPLRCIPAPHTVFCPACPLLLQTPVN